MATRFTTKTTAKDIACHINRFMGWHTDASIRVYGSGGECFASPGDGIEFYISVNQGYCDVPTTVDCEMVMPLSTVGHDKNPCTDKPIRSYEGLRKWLKATLKKGGA